MVDGRFSPAMFTFGYQDNLGPQLQNNFSNVLSRLNDDLSELCYKISSPARHAPAGGMKPYLNDPFIHQAAHRLPSIQGSTRQEGLTRMGEELDSMSTPGRRDWQGRNDLRDVAGSERRPVPRPQVEGSYKFERWMNTKVDNLMKDLGFIQHQLHTRRGQGQIIDELRQRVEQLEAKTKNSGPSRRQASFSNPLPHNHVNENLPPLRKSTGIEPGGREGRGRKPILPTVEEGNLRKGGGSAKRIAKPTAWGGKEEGTGARHGLPSIRGGGKEKNPPSKHSARARGQQSELGARRMILQKGR
mmetsp:Transcript_20511/g.68643  ORF Transcript_20511/g.68643 Transcript_20511/m.68643 type:complete len:301 (-) Transcript_20511:230-1132(-)